jgi:predicted enzyme related to lactoylglutathione lyase
VQIDSPDPECLGGFWGKLLNTNAPVQIDADTKVLLAKQSRSASVLIRKVVTSNQERRPFLAVVVSDVDEAARKAEALGGRIIRSEVNVTGVSRLVMADPEDNEFFLTANEPVGLAGKRTEP